MATYKLFYFNARGRAELARLIFAQAGVQYEDKRLTAEEWVEFKPNTEFGSMPILEVDGKQIPGSGPIARFLAERFGLAGSDDVENAYVAGIDDFLADLLPHIVKFFFEKDETLKAGFKKELEETHFPRYLGTLDKLSGKSGASEGWLIGKLTWVDFHCYVTMSFIGRVFPETSGKYSNLSKLKTSVESLPNIAKWLKERPQTER